MTPYRRTACNVESGHAIHRATIALPRECSRRFPQMPAGVPPLQESGIRLINWGRCERSSPCRVPPRSANAGGSFRSPPPSRSLPAVTRAKAALEVKNHRYRTAGRATGPRRKRLAEAVGLAVNTHHSSISPACACRIHNYSCADGRMFVETRNLVPFGSNA